MSARALNSATATESSSVGSKQPTRLIDELGPLTADQARQLINRLGLIEIVRARTAHDLRESA